MSQEIGSLDGRKAYKDDLVGQITIQEPACLSNAMPMKSRIEMLTMVFSCVHNPHLRADRFIIRFNKQDWVHVLLLQKTSFSLVKSRLALGSPCCLVVHLVVTMPKMA